ncbi:hypothetical protein IL992_38990 [Microbispora sp. NEAU-D428]|uniref:hypothetical protein n=1 Tax=Microbispora sitophila TaxID=2771537 RepID=UPI0018690773|nr:hypothetical protein [Microbispora sitophila]MBE3015111.1 hypothetical protein [Microbispora sitophila]
MSYDVYAYGPPDANGHSPELFDAPLGSGTALGHHWAAPARELGLPFLSRVAGDELLIAHDDLLDLTAELDRLEAHWAETIPDKSRVDYDVNGRRLPVPYLIDLLHRAQLFRAAIRIAEITGGHVHIF